jgi:hypothetical protein
VRPTHLSSLWSTIRIIANGAWDAPYLNLMARIIANGAWDYLNLIALRLKPLVQQLLITPGEHLCTNSLTPLARVSQNVITR